MWHAIISYIQKLITAANHTSVSSFFNVISPFVKIKIHINKVINETAREKGNRRPSKRHITFVERLCT